jgi:hypothetical protein
MLRVRMVRWLRSLFFSILLCWLLRVPAMSVCLSDWGWWQLSVRCVKISGDWPLNEKVTCGRVAEDMMARHLQVLLSWIGEELAGARSFSCRRSSLTSGESFNADFSPQED